MRFLIGLILCLAYVNGETFFECRGKPSGTFVASKRNNDCRSFIYCNGENSFKDMCSLGLAFDPLDSTCAPEEDVNCGDDDSQMLAPIPSRKPTVFLAKSKSPPTPPGRPVNITPTNSPTRSTPRRKPNGPVTTRKPLQSSTGFRPKPTAKVTRTKSPTKLTSLILSTTRKNSVSTYRPSARPKTTGSTRIPTKKTVSPIRTKSPTGIPRPPGAQTGGIPNETETRLPTEANIEVSSTKPKTTSKKPTSLPTTKTYPDELLTTSSTNTQEVTASIQEQCAKKLTGSFGDPQDCHYYYRCIRGVLNKQECPKGFGWDMKSKMCTTKGCLNNNK